MNERNFDLTVRKENTREKIQTDIIKFNLNEIMTHFEDVLTIIKNQCSMAKEFINEEKVNEGENIWRAQIVFLASAFDFYMHELTKYGLCEIYNENWEKTSKYENLQIKMEYIEIALEVGRDIDWFLEFINDYYKSVTMVSFESVKEQFNLLGINLKAVADKAFYQKNSKENTKDKFKNALNALFYRRNIIAHQMDREHKNAQIKEITEETVKTYIDNVIKIVYSINDVAHTMSKDIKGNINNKGEKIYHIYSGVFYDKIEANEWFVSKEEAENAGYRSSKR